MRNRLLVTFSGPLVRIAVVGLVLGLLAGCVAPYAYVQPNFSSGGYYTSSEPYTGTDYYGTGPYYSGTSGWGYYDGSFPYGGGFGYVGGYGAWPVFFNSGFSSVWNFPGYWGPWYATTLPLVWDCDHRCDRRRHSRHDPDHDHDAWRSVRRPWLRRDRPFVSPLAHASRLARPNPDLAIPPAVRAAAFARDRFVHAPTGRTIRPDFRDAPIRPMGALRRSAFREPLRAVRMPGNVTPQGFHAMPRATYAPTHSALSRPSVRMPAPRARHDSRIKIR